MNILLAIDDSQYSAKAIEVVASRPWPPDTTVRVLSAVQVLVTLGPEMWVDTGSTLQHAMEEMKKNAGELTAQVADSLKAKGLTAQPAVREGDPRSVIVDEARKWPADLIVVGSHGRTGITRWLLGSVAQSVVSHAPCSVEVVRAKSAERS